MIEESGFFVMRQSKQWTFTCGYGIMKDNFGERETKGMYSFSSRVRYSETDVKGRLTLTGIINYLQDCSTFQSESLGKGIAYLREHHRAWWLSSWQIVIDRYPLLGETITISTWPYEFKGIYGYRNFAIQDAEGNYLVRANSIWFFYDTEAGRPVRAGEEDIRGYGAGEERLAMDYAPRRIALPENYETKEPVLVMRHHIDSNNHVNNAQYVEIARELLPEDFQVGELRVEYKKAAVRGDYMIPRISRQGDAFTAALCDEAGKPHAVVWLAEKSD